jgi:hypothetical protein
MAKVDPPQAPAQVLRVEALICLFHPKVIFDIQRQLHLSVLRL